MLKRTDLITDSQYDYHTQFIADSRLYRTDISKLMFNEDHMDLGGKGTQTAAPLEVAPEHSSRDAN